MGDGVAGSDWTYNEFEPKTKLGDERPPLTPTGELEIRIEALRAAAHAVAPLWAELAKEALANGTAADVVPEIGPTVLDTAEQFAKWLETGEG